MKGGENMVFQERTYSVLLVTASDSFTAKIMPLLPVTDYWPVTTVHLSLIHISEPTRPY